MRVLIGCEFSGVVRDAFCVAGHDAWSCDLLDLDAIPCDFRTGQKFPSRHLQGDVRKYVNLCWDLAIFHPPCTHLAASGARWWKDKIPEQGEAINFVKTLLAAPIERIAIENPIGILTRHIGKPAQIIQPWQFGHGEIKATCLWLKGLLPLTPTDIVEGRRPRVHCESEHEHRWMRRSKTLPGIAEAMAAQWGV